MLLLSLLLACGAPPGSPADAAGQPVTLSASDVATVKLEPISSGPRVSGTLEPAARAVMRAEAGGSVETVSVEIGDHVKKGQVLATIESAALRQSLAGATAAVAAAEANAENAAREVERVGRLKEAGALSQRDVEAAVAASKSAAAQLEAARAQRAAAQQQSSGAAVRAPFDGVVSTRDVSAGDIVGIGSPMFTIIEPSTLRLSGAVPADSVGALTPGASVRFQVQGLGSRPFEGQIERISPSVDPATRQIPILVSIPNQDGALLAGLFAEGRVARDVHDGLVAPADALDGDHVLRVRDGHVERVDVTVGSRDEDAERIELKGTVSAGDLLLVGAARSIAEGASVTLPSNKEG